MMRGCRPLTDEEVVLVTDHLRGRHGARNRVFFILGLKSGLRCRELLGLRIQDVWDEGILERIQVRRSTTKGKQCGFSLPLHPIAAASLELYIKDHCASLRLSSPLFRSAKCDPVTGGFRALNRSTAWRILKQAYQKAGLKGNTGCHSMRKTYCQKIYQALGCDLIATQAAMHHTTITSTIRYLSFDNGKVDAAILAI